MIHPAFDARQAARPAVAAKRPRRTPPRAREHQMNDTILREDLRFEPLRASTPDPQDPLSSPAFADLFHAVDALRVDGQPIVLQVAGTDIHARTAGVASGFARTAARSAPSPILYVDATGGGIWAGPDMLRAFRDGLTPAEIALPTHEPRIRWAATGRMLALAGEDASRLLDAIRRCFAVTVIDCGPMGSGTSAIPLARHCDGSVLVSEADKTRASAIGLSRTAIERAGGKLLGAVLNSGDSALPRWLASRL